MQNVPCSNISSYGNYESVALYKIFELYGKLDPLFCSLYDQPGKVEFNKDENADEVYNINHYIHVSEHGFDHVLAENFRVAANKKAFSVGEVLRLLDAGKPIMFSMPIHRCEWLESDMLRSQDVEHGCLIVGCQDDSLICVDAVYCRDYLRIPIDSINSIGCTIKNYDFSNFAYQGESSFRQELSEYYSGNRGFPSTIESICDEITHSADTVGITLDNACRYSLSTKIVYLLNLCIIAKWRYFQYLEYKGKMDWMKEVLDLLEDNYWSISELYMVLQQYPQDKHIEMYKTITFWLLKTVENEKQCMEIIEKHL